MVAVLVAVAVYFGRQQFQALRILKLAESLPADDRRYAHRQAWRRLFGCGLLLVIAAMLAWWYLSGQDRLMTELGELKQKVPEGQKLELNDEQKSLVRTSIFWWNTILALLLVTLILAGFDVWAIRRYGTRHYRRIMEDRNAMLERQLAQLRIERGERNGKSRQ